MTTILFMVEGEPCVARVDGGDTVHHIEPGHFAVLVIDGDEVAQVRETAPE